MSDDSAAAPFVKSYTQLRLIFEFHQHFATPADLQEKECYTYKKRNHNIKQITDQHKLTITSKFLLENTRNHFHLYQSIIRGDFKIKKMVKWMTLYKKGGSFGNNQILNVRIKMIIY